MSAVAAPVRIVVTVLMELTPMSVPVCLDSVAYIVELVRQ